MRAWGFSLDIYSQHSQKMGRRDMMEEKPKSVPPQLPATTIPQLLQSKRWADESKEEEPQTLNHTLIHADLLLDQ